MADENEKLPLVASMVYKPILERLKKHLRAYKGNFTNDRHGDDGCDTCGYGASTYEDLDFDALCREIDRFGEELREKKVD